MPDDDEAARSKLSSSDLVGERNYARIIDNHLVASWSFLS